MGINVGPGKDWISKMKMKKGALGKKAKKAGQSTQGFAKKNDKGNSKTAKQSRLAEVFKGMHEED